MNFLLMMSPAAWPISRHIIYYLKTHKTGSSTMVTMILKYGIIRNRTIALDLDLAHM